jgi:putative membrane protein
MLRKITYITLEVFFLFSLYIILSPILNIRHQPFTTSIFTLLGFTFAVLHAGQILGWRRAILLFSLTFLISLFFESVGVATGWIYGPYHYTDLLGAKFLNLVPYLIPIAWFMMSYPAFIITYRILKPSKNLWLWHLGIATIGATVMTAWDLAMDPMMVASGHWVWEVDGGYFSIPLQNFWGWWLTIFVTYIVFTRLIRLNPKDINLSPYQDYGFLNLAIYSYIIIGASTVITDFQAGLSGPGLVGIFGMAPWIIMALLKL